MIVILGSLALTATFLVDGINEQSRYDDTKTRLKNIRTAIIGDTSRTLNGEPLISGYVADMGRLPTNLNELLEIGDQPPYALDSMTDGDITINLNGGWRGPYLDALPENDGVLRYRDGWGNGNLTDNNFGWIYSENPNPDSPDLPSVSIQSLGANGIVDITPATVYDADYPATGVNLIEANDYAVTIDTLTVRLNKSITTSPGQNLRVKLYTVYEGVIDPAGILSDELTPVIGEQTLIFNIENAANLGTFAAVVFCKDMKVYDGNCDAINTNQPYYFKAIPRADLPVIPWNIQ